MHKRVVFVLFSYNQDEFIRDAVRSALAQDYFSLEILISDDASSDDTFAIIEAEAAAYQGPHDVRLNRNAVRLGSVDHLAMIGEMVGPDAFIIMAHGDDISAPDRTASLVDAWKRKRVSMVSSAARWIGTYDGQARSGRPSRLISASAIVKGGWMPEMLGAALAFDADVLTSFKRLTSQSLGWGLDHVLPLRAAALKGFYYLASPLVDYRRHGNNMSNFIADRSGSRDVLNEGLLTYEIAIRQHQRDDLLTIARSRRLDPRRWLLLRKLEQRLIDDIVRWSQLRAKLKGDGFSPTWIPTEDLHARVIAWEARF